jgi:hypothetical protein
MKRLHAAETLLNLTTITGNNLIESHKHRTCYSAPPSSLCPHTVQTWQPLPATTAASLLLTSARV